MAFESLSMRNKFVVSMLPTVIAIAGVSFFIFSTGFIKDEKLARTVAMEELANKMEIEMVKMSEALRGYLLNPSDKGEAATKKAADERFAAYAEELDKLSVGFREIQEISRKTAEFDATTLNDKENEVMQLIEEGSSTAPTYYRDEYAPVRRQQDASFAQLKRLVEYQANAALRDAEERARIGAIWTIGLLWAGGLLGLGITLVVSFRATSAATTSFAAIQDLSNKFASLASNLRENSSTLSEATTQEAAAIQETVAAVDQIRSIIAKNAANAQRSRTSSATGRNMAEDGRSAMQDMVDVSRDISESNDQIMNQVNESNRRIGEIVDLISQIETKTKVINDIVFQTKLLSFNASVEAARAGDQGKGFAVVAEEVGSLARMSGDASREISGLLTSSVARVTEIVAYTKASVESLVTAGRTKAAKGTETASRCGSMLSSIASSVGELDGLISELSNASHEQEIGIEEIGKAMNQIDGSVHKNSAMAQDGLATAQRLNEQAEALRGKVSELYTLFNGASKKAA